MIIQLYCISKGKDTHHKRTNNGLENTTQKAKYRATRTSLKAGGELRCCGRASSIHRDNDINRLK